MSDLLLIDGANLLCRNYAVFRDVEGSHGKRLGGLYGFLSSISRIVWKFPEYIAVVVWDAARAPWRLALYPEYKQRRKRLDEDDKGTPGYVSIDEQVRLAEFALRALGVATVRVRGVEADDAIAYLSRAARRSVIYSTDRDFFQLVRKGHAVFRPDQSVDAGEVTITDQNFGSTVKVRVGKRRLAIRSAWYYRAGTCIAGDSGDNIPGVRRVGWGTAIEIVRKAFERDPGDLSPETGTLEVIREVCAASSSKRWTAVDDHWEDFELALQLMDLWRTDLLSSAQVRVLVGTLLRDRNAFDPETVIRMLETWDFPDLREGYGFIHHAMSVRRSDLDVRDLDFRFLRGTQNVRREEQRAIP